MRHGVAVLLLAGLCAPATPAIGHGGGLDARGCHTNKRTGEYHCHQQQAGQQSGQGAGQQQAPRAQRSDYYASCSEARAAGVAPLRRGDRGYRAGLDRDGDGIACE